MIRALLFIPRVILMALGIVLRVVWSLVGCFLPSVLLAITVIVIVWMARR